MIDFITKGVAKLFGTKSQRDLKQLEPLVAAINVEYDKLGNISDDELREKTIFFKATIKTSLQDIEAQKAAILQQIAADPEMDINEKEKLFNQIDKLGKEEDKKLEETLRQILPEAFAVVRETARRWKDNGKLVVKATPLDREIAAARPGVLIEQRANGEDLAVWASKWLAAGTEITWEMVHYNVQLIGGIVLHDGKIAEMSTGEGKTLVATLPAYLNALGGKGVHIVTVNDYLAKRDSEWMGPLFEFHGLRVDCIDKHQPNTFMRRRAYQADITYGTNNEFGFDYLRDNMVREIEELVQRKHHYAMVDEVDSVLIDDARTPLIIAGPVGEGNEEEKQYFELKPRILKLVEAQKRLVNGFLTEAKKKLETGNDEEGGRALFRAHRGLPKSKPLIKFLSEPSIRAKMQKVENFYLQDNSKAMPEADKPLYFVIDEKNNSVDLTENGINLITESGEDNSFFILPDLGSNLAVIERNPELDADAKLRAKDQLITDYTTKNQLIHSVNQLLKAYTLFERDTEYIVDDGKVKLVDENTGRIMDGRRFSDGLHQALEAKENVKIEEATQTYATITLQNFFRMYHKLAGMTGTASTEAGEFWDIYKLDVVEIPTNVKAVRKDHEDKVYKTAREKYNAVAEEIQALVNAGRPVLVGTASVENSELLSRMLQIRKIPHQVLNAKQHAREADIVANAGVPGTVTIATNMAGRGTDIKLTPESRRSGGLAIVGTERHDSRRVDRQLRGRSGRQGDPGSSQFFVALEDNLMRLFGSERIAKIMDRMGLEEGEVIQHSMITASLERAQKKVEENNFGTRKRLLEYDDVMNKQRQVVYARRRNALLGDRLKLDVMTTFYDVAHEIVESSKEEYDDFQLKTFTTFGFTTQISESALKMGTVGKLGETLYEEALDNYNQKNQHLAEVIYPQLASLHANQGNVIKNVVIPFGEGRRRLDVIADLAKSVETSGKSVVHVLEQSIVLALIDQYWKEHLREMDDLRQQVQFASLEQKDPLLIYKFEGFQLFKGFVNGLNEQTSGFLSKVFLFVDNEEVLHDAQRQREQEERQRRAERQRMVAQKEGSEESVSTQTPANNRRQVPQLPRQNVEITKPVAAVRTPGRNDKVSVQYADGTVKKEVKFKSVEEDWKNNRCVII